MKHLLIIGLVALLSGPALADSQGEARYDTPIQVATVPDFQVVQNKPDAGSGNFLAAGLGVAPAAAAIVMGDISAISAVTVGGYTFLVWGELVNYPNGLLTSIWDAICGGDSSKADPGPNCERNVGQAGG